MFFQSQAFPIIKKARKSQILSGFLYFQNKPKVLKKNNFKTWLQKNQIGNPAVL